MTIPEQIAALPPIERRVLTHLVQNIGLRVRRGEAMEFLGIHDDGVFRKFVDANPEVRHRLDGERQDKYLTVVLFLKLPASSRCAACGEVK